MPNKHKLIYWFSPNYLRIQQIQSNYTGEDVRQH